MKHSALHSLRLALCNSQRHMQAPSTKHDGGLEPQCCYEGPHLQLHVSAAAYLFIAPCLQRSA